MKRIRNNYQTVYSEICGEQKEEVKLFPESDNFEKETVEREVDDGYDTIENSKDLSTWMNWEEGRIVVTTRCRCGIRCRKSIEQPCVCDNSMCTECKQQNIQLYRSYKTCKGVDFGKDAVNVEFRHDGSDVNTYFSVILTILMWSENQVNVYWLATAFIAEVLIAVKGKQIIVDLCKVRADVKPWIKSLLLIGHLIAYAMTVPEIKRTVLNHKEILCLLDIYKRKIEIGWTLCFKVISNQTTCSELEFNHLIRHKIVSWTMYIIGIAAVALMPLFIEMPVMNYVVYGTIILTWADAIAGNRMSLWEMSPCFWCIRSVIPEIKVSTVEMQPEANMGGVSLPKGAKTQYAVRLSDEDGNTGTGFIIRFEANDGEFHFLVTVTHVFKNGEVWLNRKWDATGPKGVAHMEHVFERKYLIMGDLMFILIDKNVPSKLGVGVTKCSNQLPQKVNLESFKEINYGDLRMSKKFTTVTHTCNSKRGDSGAAILMQNSSTVVAVHWGAIKVKHQDQGELVVNIGIWLYPYVVALKHILNKTKVCGTNLIMKDVSLDNSVNTEQDQINLYQETYRPTSKKWDVIANDRELESDIYWDAPEVKSIPITGTLVEKPYRLEQVPETTKLELRKESTLVEMLNFWLERAIMLVKSGEPVVDMKRLDALIAKAYKQALEDSPANPGISFLFKALSLYESGKLTKVSYEIPVVGASADSWKQEDTERKVAVAMAIEEADETQAKNFRKAGVKKMIEKIEEIKFNEFDQPVMDELIEKLRNKIDSEYYPESLKSKVYELQELLDKLKGGKGHVYEIESKKDFGIPVSGPPQRKYFPENRSKGIPMVEVKGDFGVENPLLKTTTGIKYLKVDLQNAENIIRNNLGGFDKDNHKEFDGNKIFDKISDVNLRKECQEQAALMANPNTDSSSVRKSNEINYNSKIKRETTYMEPDVEALKRNPVIYNGLKSIKASESMRKTMRKIRKHPTPTEAMLKAANFNLGNKIFRNYNAKANPGFFYSEIYSTVGAALGGEKEQTIFFIKVWELIHCWLNGEPIHFPYRNFAKQELHKKKKIEEGRIRVIWNPTYIEVAAYKYIMFWHESVNIANSNLAIGIDMTSPIDRRTMMSKVSKGAKCTDMSSFDFTVKEWEIKLWVEMLLMPWVRENETSDDLDMWNNLRNVLLHRKRYVSGYTPDGKVQNFRNVQPSGEFDTTMFNSFRRLWAAVAIGSTQVMTHGDDAVENNVLSDEALIDAYTSMGYSIKGEIHEYEDKIEFLGNEFDEKCYYNVNPIKTLMNLAVKYQNTMASLHDVRQAVSVIGDNPKMKTAAIEIAGWTEEKYDSVDKIMNLDVILHSGNQNEEKDDLESVGTDLEEQLNNIFIGPTDEHDGMSLSDWERTYSLTALRAEMIRNNEQQILNNQRLINENNRVISSMNVNQQENKSMEIEDEEKHEDEDEDDTSSEEKGQDWEEGVQRIKTLTDKARWYAQDLDPRNWDGVRKWCNKSHYNVQISRRIDPSQHLKNNIFIANHPDFNDFVFDGMYEKIVYTQVNVLFDHDQITTETEILAVKSQAGRKIGPNTMFPGVFITNKIVNDLFCNDNSSVEVEQTFGWFMGDLENDSEPEYFDHLSMMQFDNSRKYSEYYYSFVDEEKFREIPKVDANGHLIVYQRKFNQSKELMIGEKSFGVNSSYIIELIEIEKKYQENRFNEKGYLYKSRQILQMMWCTMSDQLIETHCLEFEEDEIDEIIDAMNHIDPTRGIPNGVKVKVPVFTVKGDNREIAYSIGLDFGSLLEQVELMNIHQL